MPSGKQAFNKLICAANLSSICLPVGKKPNGKEKTDSVEAPQSPEKDKTRLKPNDSTLNQKNKNKKMPKHCIVDVENEEDVDESHPFVCTIPGCGRTFHSKCSYDLHIADTCFLCHKRFSSTFNVRRHLKDVHKIRETLACDVCGKEFPEPISLALHNKEEHMTP